jgi:hypothetical protein
MHTTLLRAGVPVPYLNDIQPMRIAPRPPSREDP